MNEYLKEKIIIWGAGKQSELLFNILRSEGMLSNIVGIIDKAEGKWESEWHGFVISSPELLNSVSYDRIIISVWNWHSIYDELYSKYEVQRDVMDNCAFILRQKFLSYYIGLDSLPDDMRPLINHVQDHPLDFMNYDFVYEYYNQPVEILDDQNEGYYIAVISGRKMYLPKSKLNTEEKARNYVRSLLAEQDTNSPHRYLSDDFRIVTGASVLDIGAAEGIFTLLNLDVIGKAYLVESDKDWIKALLLTFSKELDRIEIIHGFVSDKNGMKSITIDSILKDKHVDFIKMDIEGAEINALKGAKAVLASQNVDLAVCAYHYPEDYDRIYRLLELYGYDNISHSDGYLTPIHYDCIDKIGSFPRLSRGILRGRKNGK